MSEEEYHKHRATCPDCGAYKPFQGKARRFYPHGRWHAGKWQYPCPGSKQPAPEKEAATVDGSN